MRDRTTPSHRNRIVAALLLAACSLAACSKSDAPPPVSSGATSAPTSAAPVPASTCPANGAWAECSLLYRLERAGLAPRVDSSAKASEKALTGRAMILKIGQSATLELHLYPDSAARRADVAKLDRSELVTGTAPQTIKRERTLIESANLVGLLTSINARQRERVADALTAGPPQSSKPQRLTGDTIR